MFEVANKKKCTVAEMCDINAVNCKLKLSFNRVIEGRALCQLMQIIELLENYDLNGEHDKFEWACVIKKLFKLNGLYKIINFSGKKRLSFKYICEFKGVLMKVKVHMWILIHGKLNTSSRLRSKTYYIRLSLSSWCISQSMNNHKLIW